MAYFSKDAKTRLVTDASPVGLGAILEQQQEDGVQAQSRSGRPIRPPKRL